MEGMETGLCLNYRPQSNGTGAVPLDQWFGGREAEPETGSEGWAGGHGEKQALGLGGTWHAMETKDHNLLSTSCEPILLWALYRGRYCGPSGCPGSPESWTEPRARRQHLHL